MPTMPAITPAVGKATRKGSPSLTGENGRGKGSHCHKSRLTKVNLPAQPGGDVETEDGDERNTHETGNA